MNISKYLVGACVLLAITALAISITALRATHATNTTSDSTIATIAALTRQLDATRATLASATYREGDNGALESYLVKLRRDGVTRSATMKQQLDNYAAQIIVLRALVDVYATDARTEAFSAEVPAFRTYALAWQDRWNALLEIFMAGGNYPASEFIYPENWSAIVETELAATR